MPGAPPPLFRQSDEADACGAPSWTVITWAVVLGSSIVMLVWIVIYSLFESFDFIDEVIVLFGGVTFWATVLLSVAIALSESHQHSRSALRRAHLIRA